MAWLGLLEERRVLSIRIHRACCKIDKLEVKEALPFSRTITYGLYKQLAMLDHNAWMPFRHEDFVCMNPSGCFNIGRYVMNTLQKDRPPRWILCDMCISCDAFAMASLMGSNTNDLSDEDAVLIDPRRYSVGSQEQMDAEAALSPSSGDGSDEEQSSDSDGVGSREQMDVEAATSSSSSSASDNSDRDDGSDEEQSSDSASDSDGDLLPVS